ncbi:hypothetical protein PIB30_056811 [Stylosanthes scabra]|uniref:Uncharacterized protein n=1 Tax=Stylosanthes scabra TaxID=79078 RepID=A0ABU6TJA0_9FABA|nr:hypothetical protein [Stylosanthes scabra]
MGTESLFNPIHRELSVNTTDIGFHSSILDLIGHEDMPRFKCGEAKFIAEVAGESKRNERIASKPRRPKLEPMRTHQGSHAYASWPWAARLFGRTDTYAYALRAFMQLRVPNGSEGKEWVKPVMLFADTPASIVAVLYSTRFTTVITGTSALGLGDSRFNPDCPGDSGYSREWWAGSLTPTQHLHLCEFELGINDPSPILGILVAPLRHLLKRLDAAREGRGAFNYNGESIPTRASMSVMKHVPMGNFTALID